MASKRLSQEEIANQKAERIMNGVATWCSYYRANPHRFCKDYLGLNLKLFQKILIFMMNISDAFMFIAARGLGKTYLTAIYCCVRAILYPGTIICIASGARSQAVGVLEKITNLLMPDSGNLRFEIETSVINQQMAFIKFKNSSVIKVVTAADSARGNRAHIIIVDEFRLVSREVIDKVLKKFLTARRHPKFLDKPEYKNLPKEENKQIYMSSAWYKSHWSYDKLRAFSANMLDDTKQYFACGFPYQLSVKEDLLSLRSVEDDMSESDFNELSFEMEMGAIWLGDSEGSLFSFDDINQNRELTYPFYPKRVASLLSDKKLQLPAKKKGEIRIITADIALMKSTKHDNDATAIFVTQALPTSGNKYLVNVVYTENLEGGITSEQALMVRRYYEEFQCDYIGIDTSGVGLGVYDTLISDIYDPLTGVTYSPLSCCNSAEMADRCPDPAAPKVIWSIKGNAQFNSDCAITLREGLRQERIKLLIQEQNCDEVLHTVRGYDSLDFIDKLQFKLPYINTSLLVNELVNLQYETKNNVVRVFEKTGFRKDRYSSLSYNYWIIKQLELKLNRPKHELDFKSGYFCFRRPKIK